MNLEGVLTKDDEKLLNGLDFSQLSTLKNRDQVWLQVKNGKFSASLFYRLMTDQKARGLSKGAMTYVTEIILQRETDGETEQYNLKQFKHGKEYEKEAVEEFQKRTGETVTKYGEEQEFIQISDYVGCTPDGLIGEDKGIETKCPDSKTHYFNLLNLKAENIKEIYPEYYWQIQGSLYITGRKSWYFVSYDPRFKNPEKRILILEIKRNEEDITDLKRKLFDAVVEAKKGVQFLNS